MKHSGLKNWLSIDKIKNVICWFIWRLEIQKWNTITEEINLKRGWLHGSIEIKLSLAKIKGISSSKKEIKAVKIGLDGGKSVQKGTGCWDFSAEKTARDQSELLVINLRNVVMVWIGQCGKQEWALTRNMSSEEPVGRKCSCCWTLRWIWSSMRILSVCGSVHAMTTGPSTASGVWQKHNKDFIYKWMDLWNV